MAEVELVARLGESKITLGEVARLKTGDVVPITLSDLVTVTIDGIPLNDAESQQVFWVDLPDLAASVESIQVQRGVGTSGNGAGAFGASVNIQTVSPGAASAGSPSSGCWPPRSPVRSGRN